MCAKLLQSCLTLHNPMDYSPPGSSIPGVFQARVLEWGAIAFSIYMYKYMYAAAAAKSLQSCPTLCHPRDSSPPGSSVPGILQARTLEWGAISLLQNICIYIYNYIPYIHTHTFSYSFLLWYHRILNTVFCAIR